MTNEKQTRRLSYTALVENVQDLSSRVAAHHDVAGFDNFVEEHNRLLKGYISTFDKFSLEEAERGRYLLDAVKSQIHGALDVYRVRSMRTALILPTGKREEKIK